MSELDPRSLVRDEVRSLKVYHLDLSPCRHKLDQNEVPFELPRAMRRRIAERWIERSWARYPDFHSDDLRAALGQRYDWPADGVLVGNGSNELLGVALEALAQPGGEVVMTAPSFGLYRMFALRAAATPRVVLAGEDLRLPIDRLLAEIERDPHRPVILCSPNNPTGDAVAPERVAELLDVLRAPLLLDNAYAEFCDYDYRPLLDRYRHLLIFRTFSKAWSLGGLRLGYLLADPDLVGELMKVKLPYNVGHGHATAAEAVLAEPEAAERRVRVLLARRPQWQAMLEQLGFEVMPSQANFLLARWPAPTTADGAGIDIGQIQSQLETRGIRVRDVSSYPLLDGCMRVSVGSGRALRDTRRALEQILPAAESRPTSQESSRV